MLTGIALPRIRWGRSECWVWVDLGGAKICWTLRSNSDKVWGFNFLPKLRLAHSFAFTLDNVQSCDTQKSSTPSLVCWNNYPKDSKVYFKKTCALSVVFCFVVRYQTMLSLFQWPLDLFFHEDDVCLCMTSALPDLLGRYRLSACVITWLCTDSPLQDCYIVLMITSNHPTHSNTGAITVAESSCTHSFPHNDPMHGFGDECVQYYSPPQSCARV